MDENIFKVYSYPEVEYLYTWGNKKEGPENTGFINSGTLSTHNSLVNYVSTTTLKSIDFNSSNPNILDQRIGLSAAQGPLNGFCRLSDSVFLADIFDPYINAKKEHRILYPNEKVGEVFGDFPDEGINFDEYIHKVSYYQKSTVANPSKERIASFYFRIPKLKIYDYQTNLIKEVNLDANRKNVHERDLKFPDHDFIYFAGPKATKDFIYILYVNADKSKVLDFSNSYQPAILKFNWDGNLLESYSLDRPIVSFAISPDNKKIYGVHIGNGDSIIEFELP